MRCSDHSLRLRRTPGIEVAGSPWWPGMRDTRWESGTTDVVRFCQGRAGRAGSQLGCESFPVLTSDACAAVIRFPRPLFRPVEG